MNALITTCKSLAEAMYSSFDVKLPQVGVHTNQSIKNGYRWGSGVLLGTQYVSVLLEIDKGGCTQPFLGVGPRKFALCGH